MHKIESIQYHRNGVSGNGFYVVTFKDDDRKMVAIIFDEPGNIAVFDRQLIGEGNIQFGENSFRGDHYESWLRDAIKEQV